MNYAASLSAYRATLFAELGRALGEGERFPEVFVALDSGSVAPYERPLRNLHDAVKSEPRKPLFNHLESSRLFLDWELRQLRVGFATLKFPEICARICDLHTFYEPSARRLSWSLATFFTVVAIQLSILIGLVASQVPLPGQGLQIVSAIVAGGLVLVPAFLLAKQCSARILRAWASPETRFWRIVSRLPGGMRAQIHRSLYQYLMNMGLCVQCGFDLRRCVNLCAEAEPMNGLRQQYQQIANSVEGGKGLGASFVETGLLKEVRLPLTSTQAPLSRDVLWSPGVIGAVRQAGLRGFGYLRICLESAMLLLAIAGALGLYLIWA